MTNTFERNEDCATVFLKWTDFSVTSLFEPRVAQSTKLRFWLKIMYPKKRMDTTKKLLYLSCQWYLIFNLYFDVKNVPNHSENDFHLTMQIGRYLITIVCKSTRAQSKTWMVWLYWDCCQTLCYYKKVFRCLLWWLWQGKNKYYCTTQKV